MKVSNLPSDVLVTYSLGSCIGLALYDPIMRVGGLLHAMLPLSSIDAGKAGVNACMFADKGVPALIEAVLDLGAGKKNLIAKVAGAANLLGDKWDFKIGQRNYVVLRHILAEHHIEIVAEDTGGSVARTMTLHINTGRTIIKSGGQEHEI